MFAFFLLGVVLTLLNIFWFFYNAKSFDRNSRDRDALWNAAEIIDDIVEDIQPLVMSGPTDPKDKLLDATALLRHV